MALTVGMLWFDDSAERSLTGKIERAAAYYQQKYGKTPNVCYVHASAMSSDSPPESQIRIVAAQDVLRHHLWIGVV